MYSYNVVVVVFVVKSRIDDRIIQCQGSSPLVLKYKDFLRGSVF